MTEVMLFPLGSVVLPEGKMRLRIFEPRYKRLIAEASKRDGTFGICLFERSEDNPKGTLSHTGCLVKIVDFETLDDGLLGITVVGIKRFAMGRVRVDFDGLRFAQVDWLPSWDIHQLSDEKQYLAQQLKRVYERFPQIKALYQQCYFDDASWVTQRWLELLPVELQHFDFLSDQKDCREAINYLMTAIEKE
ncbi:hypothetical protein VII00023_02779 [Vibrio ichthyoenteri ATCC 700023]|uniref:Lon N-terminal domain-containing protein n=1 Tax=Vibrio ichthyoenteri ATCC 700023 TaxID=870968 RepID=F9S0V7_9VIBR|nr:LON peptidase substrate-binding domain-containing protein [Vibrio ichthyoenteri]EGU42940.1 hypothetical protein VII00023_02779 [Vibrio ichthyoenteri ATCC 700023]